MSVDAVTVSVVSDPLKVVSVNCAVSIAFSMQLNYS